MINENKGTIKKQWKSMKLRNNDLHKFSFFPNSKKLTDIMINDALTSNKTNNRIDAPNLQKVKKDSSKEALINTRFQDKTSGSKPLNI